MSTAIARNFQIGIDSTPTNNFTLYQPATPDGTLRLGNGNTGITSSLLTLTSAGDLGIGTSSPANKLNVFGSDATVRTESTSEDKGLLLVKSGVQGFAVTVNGAAQRLDFSGANAWPSISQIMSLTASGNVGIGTTSPTSGYRLDVRGNVIAYADSGNVGVVVSSGTNANGAMNAIAGTGLNINTDATNRNITFSTNSVERARITSAGGFALGTTADPGAGAIFATGNITAYYSDDRLKTRLGYIENALDKVDQLSGFYYEANETAQALGYKVKREVGVSAQQVQAVLPELVSPAPIDEKYLTVDYERLVPLLIEAIKELRAEVKALKG